MAKRALEVAAAGGHNLLFLGPPGSGKTMLARRLPGILPPLSLAESIAVTKVHSLVAEEPPAGLLRQRPFRSPHTGTSTAGMIGGGSNPRPGEASLAHNGVLFLDELPEFRRDTLEALRQPLEEGNVSVVRGPRPAGLPGPLLPARRDESLPLRPSGGSEILPAAARRRSIERYRGRVSGPLLDRIDLHVEVPAVSLAELRSSAGESTETVARRVAAARAVPDRALRPAHPDPDQLRHGARAAPPLLRRRRGRPGRCSTPPSSGWACRRGRSTACSRWPAPSPTSPAATPSAAAHLAEAIQYRSLDRRVAG